MLWDDLTVYPPGVAVASVLALHLHSAHVLKSSWHVLLSSEPSLRPCSSHVLHATPAEEKCGTSYSVSEACTRQPLMANVFVESMNKEKKKEKLCDSEQGACHPLATGVCVVWEHGRQRGPSVSCSVPLPYSLETVSPSP